MQQNEWRQTAMQPASDSTVSVRSKRFGLKYTVEKKKSTFENWTAKQECACDYSTTFRLTMARAALGIKLLKLKSSAMSVNLSRYSLCH